MNAKLLSFVTPFICVARYPFSDQRHWSTGRHNSRRLPDEGGFRNRALFCGLGRHISSPLSLIKAVLASGDEADRDGLSLSDTMQEMKKWGRENERHCLQIHFPSFLFFLPNSGFLTDTYRQTKCTHACKAQPDTSSLGSSSVAYVDAATWADVLQLKAQVH